MKPFTQHDARWCALMVVAMTIGAMLPWGIGIPQIILCGLSLGRKLRKLTT